MLTNQIEEAITKRKKEKRKSNRGTVFQEIVLPEDEMMWKE